MKAQEILDKIQELKKETPDADVVVMPCSYYRTLIEGFFEIDGKELPPNMYVLGLEIIYFNDASCSGIHLHKNTPIDLIKDMKGGRMY